MAKKSTSIEQELEVIRFYKEGHSKEEIKRVYGISPTVCNRIFKNAGITLRDHSHKKRYYALDETYFDIIDTPNKAYILGLLYADGTNYRPMNCIKIALQDRDANILGAIKQEFKSNHPVRVSKLSLKNPNWSDSYIYTVVNKHMSEQLEKLGMVQNKSLILTFPEWLRSNLIPHFIRGYTDGDGHIEVGERMFVTIASTEYFCLSLQKYLRLNCSISSSIYNTTNKHSSTRVLSICGMKNMKSFLDLLYKDAEMCFERKKEDYQRFCERVKDSPTKWRLVGVT